MARTSRKRKEYQPRLVQQSILDYVASLDENNAIDNGYSAFEALLNGIRTYKQSGDEWRGLLAIPPGSIMQTIVTEFSNNTTVPLEIPHVSFLSYLAGYLLANDIHMQDEDRRIDPDIWTQVLADSGEGKSFSFREIGVALPEFVDASYNISDPESAAAFFDSLKENNNKLLYRDEFWSMLDKMQSGKPLDGVKDYMMRAYNHEDITRRTKKDGKDVIKNAKFAFIGISVAEPVLKRMSEEDFVSGFLARFNYIFADIIDPDRVIAKFRINKDKLRQQWALVREKIKHKTYYPSKDADRAFSDTMEYFLRPDRPSDVARGVIRRTVETAHKYALLYHIARGHGDDEIISAEDYGWAARMVWLHIADLKRLFRQWGANEYDEMLTRCEGTVARFEAKFGREITARELLMRQKSLKDIDRADKVLRYIRQNAGIKPIRED